MDLQIIHNNIFEIRGVKVMLDFHLAELYEIETRTLKQAVNRKIERFPKDFMFLLSDEEINSMVSQFVIPSKGKFGGAKPMVFTEQGVAMLSSVINSPKAIKVNIEIMRAFVAVRQFVLNYKELDTKIKDLETKYDNQFSDVFQVIDYLATAKQQQEDFANREPIGFIKPKPKKTNTSAKINSKKKN